MVGGGSFCGDLGVFALVMDFKEVMLTSPPELAHCAPPPTVGQQVCITSQGKKSNFGPKALRKEFSTPNMRQKCGNSPYSVHQWIGN